MQKSNKGLKKTVDRLTRRKFVTFDDTSLPRVLNTIDLTALGIGSTVGVGFYVLAGEVAKNTAGPAVTISFFIAAIASVFAGLCYAEFGARVPKAGSAYIYSYVCVGEFVAFIIGWNLILEYIIGTASVARGYSGYVDELANNAMSEALGEAMPISVSFLSKYPDFLAFGLSFLLSIVLAGGVKESSRMNNFFTFINLIVITYVIIAVGTQADGKNWALTPQSVNITCYNGTTEEAEKDYGNGGFAPYGFAGIMHGAATCFFGFVGFDCIATTGEEAIKPERSIPMSIGLSLLFVFVAYFGMSAVITLALPYCLQDENAPLVHVFDYLDWNVAKWIVSIGALFGFSASLFGAMFPLPRVIYAMADDGLLFRFLSKINKKFKTPMIATILSGLFAGFMAMIFNLDALVDMMSIGTLLAYSIVAVCVMLLRYEEDDEGKALGLKNSDGKTKPSLSMSKHSASEYFHQLFNLKGLKEPTDLTASLASFATLSFCITASVLGILLVALQDQIANGEVAAIVGLSVAAAIVITNVVIIARQPESKKKLSFKVPLVPWVPALSAFINLYLMFNLSSATWIRFSVWMAIGFLIYFVYGLWNSTEELKAKGKWKGVENHAFVNDEKNLANRLHVIPTIEIHPATPTNSEPNTPRTFPKSPRNKTPIPESPLVTAERKTTVEVHRKSNESVGENEIQEALASLDFIVNGNEKQRLDSETNSSILEEGDISLKEYDFSTTKRLSENEIQSRELPPLPDQNTEEEKISPEKESQSDTDNSEVKEDRSSISSDPGYESLHNKKQTSNVESGNKPSNDPGYETLEDVKAEIAEEENKNKTKLGSEEKTNQQNQAFGQASPLEPVYSVVEKKSKKKPDPLDLTADPEKSSSANEPMLKVSASAPVLPLTSSPPPPPPPLPQLVRVSSTSSVPNTPVSRKHPFRPLKRMSSFDDIPPSSPDSPLARRLDKFIIIPVREPDSDSDNSNQASPRQSLQDPLMKELLTKFNNNKDKDSIDGDNDHKEKKMFYVASDDSLESALSGQEGSFITNLPSPTINGQTREFRRVLTKESMLDGLDTIRERGESKIFNNDEEKQLKENTSVKSQDLILENDSETQKGSHKDNDILDTKEVQRDVREASEVNHKDVKIVDQDNINGLIEDTKKDTREKKELSETSPAGKEESAEITTSSSNEEHLATAKAQLNLEQEENDNSSEAESKPEIKQVVYRSQSNNEKFNKLKSMFEQ